MKGGRRDELAILRRLREVTCLLSGDADPKRLVPTVLDHAIGLVGAERGFVVVLVAGPPARFEVAAARSLDREDIRQPELKLSRSIVERVARGEKAELVLDAQADESVRNVTSVKEQELRSILCVPLRVHGRSLGVVYVDHRFHTGKFDEGDLATLEAFAVPAAIVLDAATRMEELKRRGDELATRVATIERLRADLAASYKKRSSEANRLLDEVARSARAASSVEPIPGLIGRSGVMKRLVQLVRRVAPSDVPVLVAGESGSGKELVARALHDLSKRRGGPFLAENCAALADPLLESELFGHEQGAFTGAVKQHQGLFEAARGGTLLLDEVGEMSPSLQAKLLRVVQEHEVRRVGGGHSIPVDVRIVTATHRDLEAMVASGAFRADLFYRLNVMRIDVPPLRERVEDLPALLDHCLEKASDGRTIRVEPQARELLLAYSWPGNVRELENEVRRLVVLAEDGVVRPALLSPHLLGRLGSGPSRAAAAAPEEDKDDVPLRGVWRLDELEKEMVLRALRRA
ncbi:sigma 54-interacting transcriptional regulator, partial [bacterium]|nr:sigma 54-interacting transcriptional regulator [bacterium]